LQNKKILCLKSPSFALAFHLISATINFQHKTFFLKYDVTKHIDVTNENEDTKIIEKKYNASILIMSVCESSDFK